MGTGRQYGDRVRYACSTGYRLIGADDSTCQADGTWSTVSPQCEGIASSQINDSNTFRLRTGFAKCANFHQPALTCFAPPPAVPHTIAPASGKPITTVGTQLILRCQEGFTPVGDMTLQCLHNQQWSTVKGYARVKTFLIFCLNKGHHR
jgi:CUB/sushi domain-containing protein